MHNIFGYCFVSISPVRAENSDRAEMVTQLLFGELIQIVEIKDNWTKIITYHDHYEGWIDTKHFIKLTDKEVKKWLDNQSFLLSESLQLKTPWGNQTIVRGAYVGIQNEFNIGNQFFSLEENQDDKLNIPSPFELATEYLNTAYLWGGKSPFGIDCSGLTQQVYRYFGLSLPRDASEQISIGRNIEFDEAQKNDLAFFKNKDGKIIHVGIIGDHHRIIHASGHVRNDLLTSEGILIESTQYFSHYLAEIKRVTD